MAATATALGAVPLLVMRRISAGVQAMLLGFGAGVMLAASIFSLLIPALAAAQAQATSSAEAAVLVAIALGAGAALLLAMDRTLPHAHAGRQQIGHGRVALLSSQLQYKHSRGPGDRRRQ